MTKFNYIERIPRCAGLQDVGTTIFDEHVARAFGRDAFEDGLEQSHNPYCVKNASAAYLSWADGWVSQSENEQ